MQTVVVVIGAGQIGQAIARRVAVGKHVVLAEFGNVIARGGSGVVISSQSRRALDACSAMADGLRRSAPEISSGFTRA
jgi:predicted dinucleotide-binding enzyme